MFASIWSIDHGEGLRSSVDGRRVRLSGRWCWATLCLRGSGVNDLSFRMRGRGAGDFSCPSHLHSCLEHCSIPVLVDGCRCLIR